MVDEIDWGWEGMGGEGRMDDPHGKAKRVGMSREECAG